MDQNSFTGLGVRTLEQRTICGGVRHAESGALSKRDLGRQRMHTQLVAERQFGASSCDRAIRVNPVAHLEAFHVTSQSFDHTSRVGARGIWQAGLSGISAGSNVSIYGIHAYSFDSHQHLTSFRLGIGHFLNPQHFRPAKVAHSNRFHECTSS